MVRVPLILVGPGVPGGRVIRAQASQIDILPTLLGLLQLPMDLDPPIQGRNLLPLIAGRALEERPVYIETYSGKSMSPRVLPFKRTGARFQKPPALVAIRTSEWKCIWVPDDPQVPTELYRLSEDPDETKNLIAERPEIAAEMKAYLQRLRSSGESPDARKESSPEEQALLEKKLRELGYL
jgi:arylsulfatase A-like enzyme